MIDKVVRLRGLQGRFGLDHSEIMNYEFEQANKQREEHMNYLVYKSQMSEGRCSRSHIEGEEWNKENKQGKLTSTVLFKRLSEKDLQMERTQNLKSNLNVDVYPEKAIPITTTTENNSNSEEDSREGLTF